MTGKNGLLEQKLHFPESENFSCNELELWLYPSYSRVENRIFPVVWQPRKLLTLSREPVRGPKAIEAQFLLVCLCHLPRQCCFSGQLADYLPAAWNVLPAPSNPLELSSPSVFSLFSSLFTSLFLLYLSPKRCFCPTVLGGECKVAEPLILGVLLGCSLAEECGGANAASTTIHAPVLLVLEANSVLLPEKQFTEDGHSGYSAFVTLVILGMRARSWAQQCLFTWVLLQGDRSSEARWKGQEDCPVLQHDPCFTRSHHVSQLSQQPLPWTLWGDLSGKKSCWIFLEVLMMLTKVSKLGSESSVKFEFSGKSELTEHEFKTSVLEVLSF